MSIYNSYYPARIGDQLLWLTNFRDKISGYETTLGYTTAEVKAVSGRRRPCHLPPWPRQTAAGQFAESINAYIRTALDGPIGAVAPVLPAFSYPADPPRSVPPGALKRLFAFVKNLKNPPRLHRSHRRRPRHHRRRKRKHRPHPLGKAEARSGEVLLTFKKMGHLGVWIESRPRPTPPGATSRSTPPAPTTTTAPCASPAARKAPLPPLLLGRRPDKRLERHHRSHLRRVMARLSLPSVQFRKPSFYRTNHEKDHHTFRHPGQCARTSLAIASPRLHAAGIIASDRAAG